MMKASSFLVFYMRVLDFLKFCVSSFLDIFFPRKCIFCKKEGEFLCSSCIFSIPLQKDQFCPKCRKISELGKTHAQCISYTSLSGLLSACHYQKSPVLQKALYHLKYHFNTSLRHEIASLMIRVLSQTPIGLDAGNVLFVSIPLHPTRRRWRGFNHAELLARSLAEYYNFPHISLLRRTRYTKQQSLLKKSDRIQNVHKAFILNTKIDHTKWLQYMLFLVDDVISTGATMEEAARVLKEAGYQNIWGLVAAGK